MSHIAKYTSVKLKKANKALMKETLKLIAKRRGGKVGTEVRDYLNGNPQKVDMSVTTKDFTPGLGVNFKEDGAVEFVGDQYISGWSTMENEVVQTYTALATAAAAKRLGYDVELKQAENGDLKVIATTGE